MKACLQDQAVPRDDRDLYDLRYFYVDGKGVGHYTCGVAFETMMRILRSRRELFCASGWYSTVRKSTNPVVRGFIAEQICLSSIANDGLTAIHDDLGPMATATFETVPDWYPFLNSGHTHRLFIPTAYNFKAVDGVILLLNRSGKSALMLPIQFTLSPRHRSSDDVFYTTMWWEWVRPLEEAGFKVESTFVWIDPNQPADEIKDVVIKAFRHNEKTVRPGYRAKHIEVEKVDLKLASALGIVTC